MILDHLDNWGRYAGLCPLFARAFAFLRRAEVASLPAGRHELDGERLYAVVVKSDGAGRQKAVLETHRRYIDVQLVVSGTDEMGWRPAASCAGGKGYDAAKDLELFSDRPLSWATVGPGTFAVFFPADAHAPGGGTGPLHRVVVKVLQEK